MSPPAQQPAPTDIRQVLAITRLSSNAFQSVHAPARMGAYVTRAFGGITSALCLSAAYATLSPEKQQQHIYSLQGNFLGPALIDRPLEMRVQRVRDTRTFATRLVEGSQVLDDGSRRVCVLVIADFMAQEENVALVYSRKPRRDWGSPEEGETLEGLATRYVEEGKISAALKEVSERSISFALGCFEMRFATGAPFGELLMGGAKELEQEQDGLAIADKVSADWIRSRARLETEVEHVGALTCLSDMAMGFIAVAHNKESLGDYGAVSSLDFSLRFFSNKIDMNEFHLREMVAKVGAEGRSYHEACFWDKNMNMVACMTQQAIIRPKQVKQKKAKI